MADKPTCGKELQRKLLAMRWALLRRIKIPDGYCMLDVNGKVVPLHDVPDKAHENEAPECELI
jgi:hypothetical protein